jgi:toxin ParE1/3/4
MAEILWTETALRTARDIIEYVAEDSFVQAEKLHERLMDAPDILIHTPRIGRRVPEFKRDDFRELLTVRPYRIMYQVDGDVCRIIAVVHGKRDLQKAMTEDQIEEPP